MPKVTFHRFLILCSFVLFSLFMVSLSTKFYPEWDGRFNLEIPLNLFLTGKYATNIDTSTFHGKYTTRGGLFDPIITTGPAVLLPIALGFNLFRFKLTASQVVLGIYYALFPISIIVWLLYRLENKKIKPQKVTRILALSLVFVVLTALTLYNIGRNYAFSPLGEVPGTVFLIFSFFIFEAAYRNRSDKLTVVAGVLAMLSIYSKLIFVFPLFIYYLFLFLIEKDHSRRISMVVNLGLGAGVILFFWQVFQISQMGFAEYFRYKIEIVSFTLNYRKWILTSSGLDPKTYNDFPERMTYIAEFFGHKVLWPILLTFFTLLFLRSPLNTASNRFKFALSLSGIVYFLWYLFAAPMSYGRYLHPALLLIGAAACLHGFDSVVAVCESKSRATRIWHNLLVITILVMFMNTNLANEVSKNFQDQHNYWREHVRLYQRLTDISADSTFTEIPTPMFHQLINESLGIKLSDKSPVAGVTHYNYFTTINGIRLEDCLSELETFGLIDETNLCQMSPEHYNWGFPIDI